MLHEISYADSNTFNFVPMKFLFATLAFFFCVTNIGAQTLVYSNEWMSYDSLKCSLTQECIMPGHSTFKSDAALTVHESKIYKGYSTSTFDVLYTFDDGMLYAGSASLLSDVVCTVKNGKVYRGKSTFALDCLYTYDVASGKIFKGSGTFALDAVVFTQGDMLSSVELCAVLLYLGLL